MACDWIREGLLSYHELPDNITFGEKRLIAAAKIKQWKILKGERYLRQTMIGDGGMYEFKAIPEMHKICVKYELYPEC